MFYEQGSEEWIRQRIGKATASRFKDMMSSGKRNGSIGQAAITYQYELVCERITGNPSDMASSRSIDWGNEHEHQARASYSLKTGHIVKQAGFIEHPEIVMMGASPDGLIGTDGGVEIKCPYNSINHLKYIELGDVPKEYYWQVHGLMAVTGRKWWDFCSYDPRMPQNIQCHVVKIYRDESIIKDLEKRASKFLHEVYTKTKNIMESL